jgi:hypothetical protein
MKKTPLVVGLFQALGLILYISLFATIVNSFSGTNVELGPFISIMIFLTTFVISASICSSIALGYPIILFFKGEHTRAIKTFLATIGWLVAFLIIFGLSVILIFR